MNKEERDRGKEGGRARGNGERKMNERRERKGEGREE